MHFNQIDVPPAPKQFIDIKNLWFSISTFQQFFKEVLQAIKTTIKLFWGTTKKCERTFAFCLGLGCSGRGWSRPDLTVVTAFGHEKTSAQKNIFLWKTAVFSISVGFWGDQTLFGGFRTPSEPPVPRVKNWFVQLPLPKLFF